MKELSIVHLNPFKSDAWKSIERYGRLLMRIKGVRAYTPPEYFKWFGNFIGRRILYMIAVKRFRNADVVHILDAAYANLILKLPNNRTIVTCHDVEIWRTVTRLNRPYRTFLLKCLSRSAMIVTPSKVVAEQLKALLVKHQLNSPPVRVIANGVDPIFRPALNPKEIDTSNLKLLYIANSSWPRKNFDFLLDALVNLKALAVDFNLVHLGPPLTRTQVSRIEQMHLVSNWKTVSNLSDNEVVALYQNSDLVLVPSLYEGFGYPLVEASACGIAFLASSIPTFTELLPEDDLQIAFDAQIWAEKIALFANNQDYRSELKRRSQLLAEKYTLRAHLKDYESLYTSI